MTIGTFRGRHPRSRLQIPTPGGSLDIEFIVDTGFDGDLALPAHLVSRLGSEPVSAQRRVLADGWVIKCPTHEVEVDLFGGTRLCQVLSLQGEPLIGTGLFEGQLLQMEMFEGGEVSVEEL